MDKSVNVHYNNFINYKEWKDCKFLYNCVSTKGCVGKSSSSKCKSPKSENVDRNYSSVPLTLKC